MGENRKITREVIAHRREGILRKLDRSLDKPMILLGFAWLSLLIFDLTRGLSPGLQILSTGIWIVFIIEFLIRFTIAPGKLQFLKKNWLTVIALLIPALRIFRIFGAFRFLRMARAARGLRLVSVVTSVNRGMSSLGATLRQNKFGYVMGVTLIVTFGTAAGIYAFEEGGSGREHFRSYADALWWTAMMMTTMGSDFFPRSPEGRILALLVATYAFAIWGYVTATLATFFIGDSASSKRTQAANASATESLRQEVQMLREELRQWRDVTNGPDVKG